MGPALILPALALILLAGCAEKKPVQLDPHFVIDFANVRCDAGDSDGKRKCHCDNAIAVAVDAQTGIQTLECH